MEEEKSDKSAVPLGRYPKAGIICNLKRSGAKNSDDVPDEEAEFDNPATVQAIQQSLKKYGVDSAIIEADEHLPENIRKNKIGIGFTIAEGKGGRDREAQEIGRASCRERV